ncbi:hypothetical protein K3759_18630 (plasmid) [Sulfitobacter sp. W027]|uniref:hypothetical protein n=1 Tax=Sulfitobacter sp. W027 TaxID=2867025 RepID=UPI0021A497F7|nr:hypothetical protein [Sulfitobacter sp. W027]UWR35708.1 hypothetical protein K3759_18630 [Sulfitobacter sp. W027]
MKSFFAIAAVSLALPIAASAGGFEAAPDDKVIVDVNSQVVVPVPPRGLGFGGLGPVGVGLVGLGAAAVLAAAAGGGSNGTTGTTDTD